MIASQGIANLAALIEIVDDDNKGLQLVIVETARLYLEQIDLLSSRVRNLKKAIKSEARQSDNTARLMSMP